jgi:hypothetical protein
MRLTSSGKDHEGGEDDDATAASGSGQGGESISAQPKREKSMILSELVELTDYSCAYARRVLRQHSQRMKAGKQSLVVDVRLRAARRRSPFYDEKVKAALIYLDSKKDTNIFSKLDA